jgi:hypothetical protein
MLDKEGLRHTLRTNNTYCFLRQKMFTRTRFDVTFMLTLPAFLTIAFFMQGSGG